MSGEQQRSEDAPPPGARMPIGGDLGNGGPAGRGCDRRASRRGNCHCQSALRGPGSKRGQPWVVAVERADEQRVRRVRPSAAAPRRSRPRPARRSRPAGRAPERSRALTYRSRPGPTAVRAPLSAGRSLPPVLDRPPDAPGRPRSPAPTADRPDRVGQVARRRRGRHRRSSSAPRVIRPRRQRPGRADLASPHRAAAPGSRR